MGEDEIAAGVWVVVLRVVVGGGSLLLGLEAQGGRTECPSSGMIPISSLGNFSLQRKASELLSLNVLTRLHRRKATTISVHSPSQQMQVEQRQRSVCLHRLSQLTTSAV